jgi:hypothetical protein
VAVIVVLIMGVLITDSVAVIVVAITRVAVIGVLLRSKRGVGASEPALARAVPDQYGRPMATLPVDGRSSLGKGDS